MIQSGCEFMKCEYADRDMDNNPVCKYERKRCRYRGVEDDEVQAEIEKLKADHEAAMKEKEREIERLKGEVQFMVNRAADEHLDGYRELGRRAADAENERDIVVRENTLLKNHQAVCECGGYSKDHTLSDGHYPVDMTPPCPLEADNADLLAKLAEAEKALHRMMDNSGYSTDYEFSLKEADHGWR